MTDDRLRLLVERVERINEDIKGLQDDRKDVFSEAKAVGYDMATFRKVIARRGMDPADRHEADMLLETYEAALSGSGAPVEVLPPGQRAAEMAHMLLAEQIAGLEDPQFAALLIEHVAQLLDLRAEIAALREQEANRRKLAKGEGFQVKQVAQVVRWIEQCAKHGAEAMRAGEATFLMYRGTVESNEDGADPAKATSDSVLAAKFAKPEPKKVNARDKRLAETMVWAGGR